MSKVFCFRPTISGSFVMRPLLLSVCQKPHNSRAAPRILLIFCTMTEDNIIKKLTKTDFEEKILIPDYNKGLGVEKWCLLDFFQNIS